LAFVGSTPAGCGFFLFFPPLKTRRWLFGLGGGLPTVFLVPHPHLLFTRSSFRWVLGIFSVPFFSSVASSSFHGIFPVFCPCFRRFPPWALQCPFPLCRVFFTRSFSFSFCFQFPPLFFLPGYFALAVFSCYLSGASSCLWSFFPDFFLFQGSMGKGLCSPIFFSFLFFGSFPLLVLPPPIEHHFLFGFTPFPFGCSFLGDFVVASGYRPGLFFFCVSLAWGPPPQAFPWRCFKNSFFLPFFLGFFFLLFTCWSSFNFFFSPLPVGKLGFPLGIL